MRTTIVLIAAVASLVAGCSREEAPKAESAPAVQPLAAVGPTPLEPASQWTCADGESLQLQFFADWVEVKDKAGAEFMIPQAASGPETLFESPAHTLQANGDEAVYKNAEGGETKCTKN